MIRVTSSNHRMCHFLSRHLLRHDKKAEKKKKKLRPSSGIDSDLIPAAPRWWWRGRVLLLKLRGLLNKKRNSQRLLLLVSPTVFHASWGLDGWIPPPLPPLYIYLSLSPFLFFDTPRISSGYIHIHVQYKNDHKCSLISNAKRDTRRRTLGSRRHTAQRSFGRTRTGLYSNNRRRRRGEI